MLNWTKFVFSFLQPLKMCPHILISHLIISVLNWDGINSFFNGERMFASFLTRMSFQLLNNHTFLDY